MMGTSAARVSLAVAVLLTISGQARTCRLCSTTSLNIRDAPCGTSIIGIASTGQCFESLGGSQVCELNGYSYTFRQLNYDGGSQVGWAASNYLLESDCAEEEPVAQPQTCLCSTATSSLNIRDEPCGTYIGSASTGQCFESLGGSQVCELNGRSYTFRQLNYDGGSQVGWAASNYLSESDCAVEEPGTGTGGDGECTNIRALNRAAWGARAPRSRSTLRTPVTTVFIHHTTGSRCYTEAACKSRVRRTQNYHIDNKGWADIGYNFLVGDDGQAYEGRGWTVRGAHTGSSCNGVSVAVSLMGNFETNAPSELMMNAVRNIIDCGIKQGHIVPWDQLNILGHRDVCSTACPGQHVYNQITGWPSYGRNRNICDC